MNSKRRSELENAVSLLDRVSAIVERALDQETDCLDNMPENLQMTDRYDKMENAVDSLEEAVCDLNNAKDKIAEASA